MHQRIELFSPKETIWCYVMDKCFELNEILSSILNNRIWTFNTVIFFFLIQQH